MNKLKLSFITLFAASILTSFTYYNNDPIVDFIKKNKIIVLEECTVKKVKMIPSIMMATAIQNTFDINTGNMYKHVKKSNNLYDSPAITNKYFYEVCWDGKKEMNINGRSIKVYDSQWWSHRDYTYKMQEVMPFLDYPKTYIDYVDVTNNYELQDIIEKYDLYKWDHEIFFDNTVEPTSIDDFEAPPAIPNRSSKPNHNRSSPNKGTIDYNTTRQTVPLKVVTIDSKYTDGLEDYGMLLKKDIRLRESMINILVDDNQWDQDNYRIISEQILNNKNKITFMEQTDPDLASVNVNKIRKKRFKKIFKRIN